MDSDLIGLSQPRTSSSLVPPQDSAMNWSADSSFATDDTILADINRQKGILLAPAILYTVITMVVGAVGNPLAIYIYGWKWRNTTTRWFLLWLACFDLLNCIITMPTEIYFLTSLYYTPNGNFCRMSRFFTYSINNSTAVVFVFISIDRYIRICRPHRFPMSISGAKIACTVSLFIGAGVSWPTFFLYGRKEFHLPAKNSKEGYVLAVMCSIQNDMDNTPYPFAFFIYLCCGVSACFLILAILYVLIGRVILKRRSAREARINVQLSEQAALNDGQQTNNEGLSPPQDDNNTCNSGSVTNEPVSADVNCVNITLGGRGCMDISSMGSKRIRLPKSTLMLFAITAVFVLTFLPFLIIIIVRQHFGPSFYPSLSSTMEVVVNVFARSYLVNNCANPIIYGLCNTQFSAEVRKIFNMQKPSRNSSMSRKESNGSGLQLSHAEPEA